ncbi:hypothetical protein BH24ACT3_BH24ACT3_17630 [soil metagenome]
MFPTADEFHDGVDETRNARFRDEFAGITDFPFPSPTLSVLSVHPRLIDLAERLLGTDHLRVYSIEAWAKYTGAADYGQPHHRDYLNHSLLVPAPGQPARQVEMFLYLSDVPPELGPPSFVPRHRTDGLPALPNWYPSAREEADPDHPTWVSTDGHPDLYEVEVSGAGPAGTVVAYRIETFHRGTALSQPRGARYTIHVNFRTTDADWIGRRAWVDLSNQPDWHAFMGAASPRQLELFGVPPPGHPYWTDETLAGMTQRYPGLDVAPWRS